MGKKVRVKEAAKILGFHPQTVRNWSNDGRIDFTMSPAGQRLYDVDYLQSIVDKNNGVDGNFKKVFYARSSNGNDVLIESQIEKLTAEYGAPDKVFTDKSSGLNENRKGLRAMYDYLENNHCKVYVTNKDRLSRFGFTYLEKLFEQWNCEIVVLDCSETKEPQEILMQDFMSLLASFSGKFYRIRGWEQRRKLAEKVLDEVDKHEKDLME